MPNHDSCTVVHATMLPSSKLVATALDAADVISGTPETRELAFASVGGADVGIWEHSVGVSRAVEAHEAFVVVSGRATIEVAGGETFEVGAGDVGLLAEGAETVWTVHETLRKVYVVRA